MEGLSIEVAYSGTAINRAARGNYETGKSGACKTWHVSPHAITKGGGNKSGGYNSAYEPQIDLQKTAKRYW